jgi:mxaK protein
MKRRTAHALFATAAGLCAALALSQAIHLRQAQRLADAVALASRTPPAPAATPAASTAPGTAPDGRAASTPSGAGAGAAPGLEPAPDDSAREVKLARANALARVGAHEAASKAYNALVGGPAPDALARAAMFNLGNLYLRQGAAETGPDARPAAERLPLLELAKQRFRTLLRADAGDWDARYNLERALRLAPEAATQAEAENDQPVERRRVQIRSMEPGDLP